MAGALAGEEGALAAEVGALAAEAEAGCMGKEAWA